MTWRKYADLWLKSNFSSSEITEWQLAEYAAAVHNYWVANTEERKRLMALLREVVDA